ncbi:hypothetical protein [Micromonospora sp. 15K316]|uniref:hypothetical protein n=1 Tax=Micromonospora sp. 15K316 TaxID=2530376 RepID=UPI0014054DE3|nr:hypothetical protein [Micromonospora sp. 15K316]
MNPLTGLLHDPRAQGRGFLLHSIQHPPYALRVEERVSPAVAALFRGCALPASR